MYREYRELSKADAVTALYAEMASRHRVRARSLQVISVVEVASKDCKRDYVTAFHVRTPPIDPILFPGADDFRPPAESSHFGGFLWIGPLSSQCLCTKPISVSTLYHAELVNQVPAPAPRDEVAVQDHVCRKPPKHVLLNARSSDLTFVCRN
jgi:hypothetical protein